MPRKRLVGTMAKKKPASAKVIAESALRQVKQLKREVEPKYVDLDTSTTVSTSGTIIYLHTIPEGDSDGARSGALINAKSVHGNMKLTIHGSATQTVVRLALVRVRDVNGGTPTISQCWSSGGTVGGTLALRNLQEAERYKVLWDKKVTLNSVSQPEKLVKFYQKLNSIKMRFNNTAGGNAECEGYGYFLFMISDEATNVPTVLYTTRFVFTDL